MASLFLQRARWSLQITRTPKSFAICFSTALPRRSRQSAITSQANSNLRSSQGNRHQGSPHRDDLQSTIRVTRACQTQQARAATTSSATSSPTHPASPTDRIQLSGEEAVRTDDLTSGLGDKPIVLDEQARQVDWARSFHGLSSEAFSKESAEALLAPIGLDDIEVKPDGIVYLPEIKYRRILNKAFGPGAWGLAPRGETIVTAKAVTREYALVALGRLVSVARGEQDYFSPEGIPTAVEGCKSNALMRCCKDLGVASELWDPRFIRKFIVEHAKEVWVEHQQTQKRRRIWMRKDDHVKYPFKIYTPPTQGSGRSNNAKY
ncbi:MAG: hypothetical protein Q9215_005287 [Flavoplaca cf. flavocitrina]